MSPVDRPRALGFLTALGLLVAGALGWFLPAPELALLSEGTSPGFELWAQITGYAGSFALLVLAALTALGKGWGPRTSWSVRPAFGPLEIVGLLLFSQAAVIILGPAVNSLALSESRALFLLSLLSTALSAALGMVMWHILCRARVAEPAPMLRRSTLLRDLGLGVALWIGILPLVACGERIGDLVIDLLGGTVITQDVVTGIRDEESAFYLTLSLLYVLVLAPVWEELLFRGFLHNALRRVLGIWPAALASAALFAAIHCNAHAALPLFVLGLGLALLYERNGSLAAPIGMHSAFNAINIVSILLSRGGGG